MTRARDKASAIVASFASTGIDDNADATAINIDSSERVGIGAVPNATFGSLLYTQGTPAANKPIISGYSTGNSNNAGIALFNDAGNRGIWTTGSTMRFTRTYEGNSTADVTIDASGNLGIGEASPDTQLHISSGAPVFRMEDTDTNRYIDFLYGTRVATLRNTLASGEDMDTVHPEIHFSFTDANETRNLFRIIGDNGIPRMSSAHTFTLADDSTVTIHGASAGSAGSSLFAVYEHGSGYGALVHVNYGTSTVINNSSGTQYVTTDTDGKYGCILTSNHGITFKNRAGATKTYSMSVFGSYMIGQS